MYLCNMCFPLQFLAAFFLFSFSYDNIFIFKKWNRKISLTEIYFFIIASLEKFLSVS